MKSQMSLHGSDKSVHSCSLAHALGCLQNWEPMVGNIGTIGSTSGRTLDRIGMPMAPLIELQMYALKMFVSNPPL